MNSANVQGKFVIIGHSTVNSYSRVTKHEKVPFESYLVSSVTDYDVSLLLAEF